VKNNNIKSKIFSKQGASSILKFFKFEVKIIFLGQALFVSDFSLTQEGLN